MTLAMFQTSRTLPSAEGDTSPASAISDLPRSPGDAGWACRSRSRLVPLAGLVAIGAPPLTRLLVALPAAASASGYLQAWFKFCAGFGSRGIFNFGDLGTTTR